MSSKLITDLLPEVQLKCIELTKAANAELKPLGYFLAITQTFRPQGEQDELWSHGRNGDKRPQVTWTRHSRHTKRRAWDYVFRRLSDNKVTYDGPWDVVIRIARTLGITSGADITKGRDKCHFQVD